MSDSYRKRSRSRSPAGRRSDYSETRESTYRRKEDKESRFYASRDDRAKYDDGRDRDRNDRYNDRKGVYSDRERGNEGRGSPRRDSAPLRSKRSRPEPHSKSYEWGKPQDNAVAFLERSVRPSEDPSLNINRRDGSENTTDEPPPEPNFKNSGLLAAETNTVNGVVLKYNEPPEARKPVKIWRVYVYKKEKQIDLIRLVQSAYLFGRDEKVVDVYLKHESASKQHAVVQFRLKKEKNEFGDVKMVVVPYIIDLESSNGTFVNGEEIPKSRYFELKTGDVLTFAYSTREYVLLEEP